MTEHGDQADGRQKGDEPAFEGFPGLPSLSDLLGQLQDAEHMLEEAATEAADTIVVGTAAGGQVAIEISGDLDATSVHIDPALVGPSDVTMLEDLVLAALRDALGQVAELQAGVAGSLGGAGGTGLDLSSLFESLGTLGSGLLGDLGDLGDFGSLGALGLPEALEGLGATEPPGAPGQPGATEPPGSPGATEPPGSPGATEPPGSPGATEPPGASESDATTGETSGSDDRDGPAAGPDA